MDPALHLANRDEASLPVIEAVNLHLCLGPVYAVRNVSFRVDRGEILGIIGPNGAGKTSLINMISGAYKPSAGSLRYFDQDLTSLSVHRIADLGIARTFQNVALFDGLTVLENVLVGRHSSMRAGLLSCGLSLARADVEERTQRRIADDAIAFLGLERLRDENVATLPYGIRKMVELARAVAMSPKLLVLDEPLAGMSAAEKSDVAEIIRRIHAERGVTIVMIEHDIGLILSLSHRIMALHHGEKLVDDIPAVVRRHPAIVSAYFGGRAIEAA